DIVDQTLAVIGSLVVIWNDHRLSWNISQNGNVSNVFFKSGQIWRPTLALKNSVTGIEVIGDDGNQKSIPMSVNPSGSVFWLAPAYFVSSCSVDISKFPFDTQTCEIVVCSYISFLF
ncbi:acetylcholine receptor subunit beta-like, partial [Ruditapes philippinarum]|uniref:acetylcholine receptor subunit beta-like n=1 Tax=Ruditapes philippinarum TaxID=129788 RepID=UPI00295BA1D0